MKQDLKDKKKVLFIFGVVVLILVVVGATYAYFTSQSSGTDNIDINANTSTTDNLSFQVGSAINITANESDFGIDMGNKSGSTFVRAILSANNATNTATKHYYVYLDIKENDFVYTTDTEEAELLLKVTSPTGEVTTISGLDRKTSGIGENEVTGFDITTKTGLITIADNYEITASPNKTDEWTVEVVFVNLDSDQVENAGKSFDATLVIQEEAMTTSLGNFAEYITTQVYTGTDGDNGLYLHDGIGSYENADLEAGDNSYRYSGANPNNYVCFGSSAGNCPNDNLYRIIGVFNNQVKLIKADFANSDLLGTDGEFSEAAFNTAEYEDYKGYKETVDRFYWNRGTNSRVWSESTLNTINLNTNYLTNIGNIWSSKIANHTWQVGRSPWEDIIQQDIRTSYQNEIVSPAESTTYSAMIGLMYVSDYGYAASPSNWNTNLRSYSNAIVKENNWLYMGLSEWSITGYTGGSADVYTHNGIFLVNGFVGLTGPFASFSGIRPVFYLNSDVEISGGTGTSSNPFTLVV